MQRQAFRRCLPQPRRLLHASPGSYVPPDLELEAPAAEVVLASRPLPGAAVTPQCFETRPFVHAERGVRHVPPGSVLCHTTLLSVDPFMRCRFNEDTGVDYTQ